MQTLRRLNDPERYYGLSWRGWLGLAFAGGLVYGAVRVSPLGTRATITLAVLALTFAGALLHSLAGQALGPARHLVALIRHAVVPKLLEVPERPGRARGLVLASVPGAEAAEPPSEPVVEEGL